MPPLKRISSRTHASKVMPHYCTAVLKSPIAVGATFQDILQPIREANVISNAAEFEVAVNMSWSRAVELKKGDLRNDLLSVHEIAAFCFFSLDFGDPEIGGIYKIVNSALRGNNEALILVFAKFISTLLFGLQKCPICPRNMNMIFLYRGVKFDSKVDQDRELAEYTVGQRIVTTQFLSCSIDSKVVKTFMGDGGLRVFYQFRFSTDTPRDISLLSFMNEKEVLVPPFVEFVVEQNTDLGGLVNVILNESSAPLLFHENERHSTSQSSQSSDFNPLSVSVLFARAELGLTQAARRLTKVAENVLSQMTDTLVSPMVENPAGVTLLRTTTDNIIAFCSDLQIANPIIKVCTVGPNNGDLSYLRSIGVGGRGKERGQFCGPSFMTTVTAGQTLLLVSDEGNFRVQVFDISALKNDATSSADIPCLRTLTMRRAGRATTSDAPFTTTTAQKFLPKGLAVIACCDNGQISHKVYVSDYSNNSISVFDLDTGTHMCSFGQAVLCKPMGLVISGKSLFVCDCSGNNRVVAFDINSHMQCNVIPLDGRPYGITAVTRNGSRLVISLTLADSNSVCMYDFDRNQVDGFARLGGNRHSICDISALTNSSGQLIVLASREDRIEAITFLG